MLAGSTCGAAGKWVSSTEPWQSPASEIKEPWMRNLKELGARPAAVASISHHIAARNSLRGCCRQSLREWAKADGTARV